MNSYSRILREYQSKFRIAIENRAMEKRQSQSVVLGLNSKDWSMVVTSLDVIVETSLAIQHFLETGIEVHGTKTEEGEKYLRLYGILNSTYLQQQAIIVLYRKLTSDYKGVKELIKNLEIREIRNKIASHSSDFKHGKESYVVIRHSLSKYTFVYENNEVKKDCTVEQEFVNLKVLLDKHLELVLNLFDKLYEDTIDIV